VAEILALPFTGLLAPNTRYYYKAFIQIASAINIWFNNWPLQTVLPVPVQAQPG
jgi:hypothetical protein